MAEIDGSGAIQQIWMTPSPIDKTRLYILRFYWDGETEPSVEVPMGDFFACGWGKYCQINSLPVCVNPGSAFNCYWTMPFRKKAKITLENLDDHDMVLYYQVNYTLTEVPADAAYFHAQFRRVQKLPAKTMYTILDGVQGKGQYVGTYLAWEVAQSGLVGRGRDQVLHGRRPGVPHHLRHRHRGLFLRLVQLREPRDASLPDVQHALHRAGPGAAARYRVRAGQRFGLYRWHITDPVRFEKELKVDDSGPGLADRAGVTCRWRTTSPRWPTGIRPSRMPSSHRCPARPTWWSSR